MNIKLTENDKRIIQILYKVPWAQAEHLALLIDEPVAYVTRRCIRLQELGVIGREYLAGGVLSCNYLKTKGMNLLDLPKRKIPKPTLYTYEHTLGEINTYVFMCLHPQINVKFGQIITERDILNSIIWDDDGTDKNGHRKVTARDLTLGIHRPDGYIIREKNGQQFYTAIEFERAVKSNKSNSDLLSNIESNAHVFNAGQWWFVTCVQVKNKIDKVQQPEHALKLFNYDLVLQFLEQQKEELPKQKATKTGRVQRDYIGELYTPRALSSILPNKTVTLEQ